MSPHSINTEQNEIDSDDLGVLHDLTEDFDELNLENSDMDDDIHDFVTRFPQFQAALNRRANDDDRQLFTEIITDLDELRLDRADANDDVLGKCTTISDFIEQEETSDGLPRHDDAEMNRLSRELQRLDEDYEQELQIIDAQVDKTLITTNFEEYGRLCLEANNQRRQLRLSINKKIDGLLDGLEGVLQEVIDDIKESMIETTMAGDSYEGDIIRDLQGIFAGYVGAPPAVIRETVMFYCECMADVEPPRGTSSSPIEL
ncbi:hypothetical protein JNB11_00660 [Kocuria palustris]|nr:hypothetical protein [Kocuria palustris]